jgi:anti-sigma factor RsiW
MRKSCEQIAGMLVGYADSQLSPSESDKVAEHLAKCRDCQKTLEALRKSLQLAGVIWEDCLRETETIRIPAVRKVRSSHWRRYAAIAASILFVTAASIIFWRVTRSPKEPEPTFAEIERSISEASTAARLLAAADMLAKYPDAQSIVKQQYEYIVKAYPATTAAVEAKSRIQ